MWNGILELGLLKADKRGMFSVKNVQKFIFKIKLGLSKLFSMDENSFSYLKLV